MSVRSSAIRQTNGRHNSNLHSLPRETGPAALNRLIRLMYPAFLHSHIHHENTSSTHLQSRNCSPLGTRSRCAQVPKQHPLLLPRGKSFKEVTDQGDNLWMCHSVLPPTSRCEYCSRSCRRDCWPCQNSKRFGVNL